MPPGEKGRFEAAGTVVALEWVAATAPRAVATFVCRGIYGSGRDPRDGWAHRLAGQFAHEDRRPDGRAREHSGGDRGLHTRELARGRPGDRRRRLTGPMARGASRGDASSGAAAGSRRDEVSRASVASPWQPPPR